MDLPAVIGVLDDVPSTFSRPGPPYTQFVASAAVALSRFTAGADAIMAQVSAFNAGVLDGWLDTWGLLWGVPRNPSEANVSYWIRITETVLAWVGTVPAIQAWLNLFAPGGTVTENGDGLGYVLTLPSTMTAAQVTAFFQSFNRIRPDGVPFQIAQVSGGLFLGTDEFTSDGRMSGNYLGSGVGAVLPLGATTLSSDPLLPGLLLIDPTINPSLAP